MPWDRDLVRNSVLKTGRLLIVQEDTGPGSIGQMLVAELLEEVGVHEALKAPPEVVSRKMFT